MDLGPTVRQLRRRRRLSQAALAAAAGISRSSLRRVEGHSGYLPSGPILVALARALELDAAELLLLAEPPLESRGAGGPFSRRLIAAIELAAREQPAALEALAPTMLRQLRAALAVDPHSRRVPGTISVRRTERPKSPAS
jgi:transcriptional regulator with XRE-family HTH domain